MKPICLVLGAGAGIGGTVGSRFAQEGYHTVLCRRSDEGGLNRMVESITSMGGSASGFLLNAVEPDVIEERVIAVEKEIGPIEVVVFNLGAQMAAENYRKPATRPLKWGGAWQHLLYFESLQPYAPIWKIGVKVRYW